MPNGISCERAKTLDEQIAETLQLPQAERIAQVLRLPPEAMVYFIRRKGRADEEFFAALLQELMRWIVQRARLYVRGLPKSTAEDIVKRVELDCVTLLLDQTGSRDADFLEVSLGVFVDRRTLNVVKAYFSSPWSRRSEFVAAGRDDDDDEIERPIELAPDPRPDAEAALLESKRLDACMELCTTARGFITNPRAREAVSLHYLEGWPIRSTVRGKDDLVSYFRVSEGRIKRWLAQAMKEMRAGLQIGVTQ